MSSPICTYATYTNRLPAWEDTSPDPADSSLLTWHEDYTRWANAIAYTLVNKAGVYVNVCNSDARRINYAIQDGYTSMVTLYGGGGWSEGSMHAGVAGKPGVVAFMHPDTYNAERNEWRGGGVAVVYHPDKALVVTGYVIQVDADGRWLLS